MFCSTLIELRFRTVWQKPESQPLSITQFHHICKPPMKTQVLGGGSFPLTERLAAEVLSLPICPAQTDEQTEYVIKNILKLA